jgi:hypothetical protein
MRAGSGVGRQAVDKTFFRIFISLFGGVGLIFLAIAVITFRSEYRMRSGAVRVPGVVIELEEVADDHGGALYKPVFEFYDNQDRKHRNKGSVASSPPAYTRGEEVTVLYRPENPGEAQLDSFFEAWFVPLIFGLLGSIFSAIAGGVIYFRLRAGFRAKQPDFRQHRPL